MATYVCNQLDTATNTCLQWVEYVSPPNFITELSSLSYSDINQILMLTAALFAEAWIWRFISTKAL